MSFDAEAVKDGRGRVVLVDVSLDNFATRYARWGDKSGIYEGSTGRSNRILSLGSVRRGFGQNFVATGGGCELVLDNSDGALDGLAGRENMSSIAKARFRVSVAIYDPTASPLTFEEKVLGYFVLTDWPRQTNTTLTMQLGDDVLGPLSQPASLPTLADWQAVGNASTNPLFDGFGRPDTIANEGTTPVQLAFGEDWVLAMPHLLPGGTVDLDYYDKVIVPICCTTDTVGSTAITNVRIQWLSSVQFSAWPNPRLIDLPLTVYDDVTETDVDVWRVERSPTITKNGKTFKVIYLVVRADLGCLQPVNNYITGIGLQLTNPTYDSPQFGNETLGGYPASSLATMRSYANNSPGRSQYAQFAAGVLAWYVKGVPLSARTQTTSPVQHSIDVITDLVEEYSNASIAIDATEAARVKAGNPNAACVGVIQPWGWFANNPASYVPPPSLRQALSEICRSAEIDMFVNWDGELSFASSVQDFTIATMGTNIVDMPETQLGDMERWIPSGTERHAPWNRIFFNGGKAYAAEGLPIPYQGPFDFDPGSSGIAISDRLVEVSREQGWRPWRQQANSPWYWRTIDPRARDMVRFRTGLRGLTLELGAYFTLTWTRGEGGTVYDAAYFQVEAITYASGDDSVEVEAVWRDDLVSDRAYLLDNETLLVRSKGVLTGDVSPTDGDVICNFGGTINLTTMGVAVGDILVLRCTTDPETDFSGNASFRITNVVSTTEVNVTPAFGTFNTNPIPNAEWYITRGATTYPTAVSDPTNYPSGGDMYGKVTDSGGLYSDSSAGNIVVNG